MYQGIHCLARECQVFAGESSVVADRRTFRQLLEKFLTRLPEPRHAAEELASDRFLQKVAVRWSKQVHTQFHARYPATCTFDPTEDLMRSWADSSASAKTLFRHSALTFLDAFDRYHPLPPEANVKELLEARFAERLELKRLARLAGCHPVRLRALFKKEFGMSIRDYQTRLRIIHASKLLTESDLKIDAVARTVGFRSRKNFYQALPAHGWHDTFRASWVCVVTLKEGGIRLKADRTYASHP